jgi:hypothetical protein
MKLKTYLTIAITFSCFCFSCSKELPAPLAGSWKWEKSSGGIAGITDTPASTGKTINLIITSDSKYYLYTSDTLTSSGTFTIMTRNCIHDHSDKPVMHFSDPVMDDLMIEELSYNSLTLSDDAYDGWIIKFRRN